MEIDWDWVPLVVLVIFIIFVFIFTAVRDSNIIAYEIDGTNITCVRGELYDCGYDLWGCSDGKERECVGNVIKIKRGGK